MFLTFTTLRRLFFVVLSCVVFQSTSQTRSEKTINAHWTFKKGDFQPDFSKVMEGDIVNIPHTWNNKDVLLDDKPGYYRGQGWYSKPLRLQPDVENKSYFLHFEGAGQETEVFVNGQSVGTHIGGYTGFTFDITSYLKTMENILHVRVDNTPNPDIPPLSADFTFFGGIYRDVFLIETSKTHFNLTDYGSKGIYISTPEVSDQQAKVQIKGSFKNHDKQLKSAQIKLQLKDANGAVVYNTLVKENLRKASGEFEMSAQLDTPKLWDPSSPHLYSAELSLLSNNKVLDEISISFGIRTFHFDPDKGFFLNGKALKLMGGNRHQDYIGDGVALFDEVHRSDLRLMKKMGANFIRLAHYPQDPAVLEEADRLGLMVWEEIPLVNEITISEAHNENSKTMLREMIRQHYNHPSVILWGYMNEIYWAHRFIDEDKVEPHTEATVKLAKTLEAIARQEDPTRYTAMALHNYPLYEETDLGSIPQVVGWNLYHGWYYDTFEDLGKFLDDQHKKHPERIHILSEYGAGSDTRLHSIKPERFDFTMEGQKRMIESYLEQIMERDYLAGAAYWNFIDFSSEPRVDTKPHWNQKGLLTATREIKDPYYLFQAVLLKEPFVKIAEIDWTSRAGTTEEAVFTSPVDIYSNKESVSLYVNGASLGSKPVKNHRAVFDVPLMPGKNELKAESGGVTDYLTIDFTEIPFYLKEENNVDISINAGSNHSFTSEKSGNTWLTDKAYEPGSWGYKDGKPLYVGNKIGTKEKILTQDTFIPLYQTMREGITSYQFDVEDGWYELELLFVEPYPKSRRFVGDDVSPPHKGGLRIFDVSLNNQKFIENLDLLKEFGYNYPYREKTKIKVSGGKGLDIQFNAIKGKTIISAIKLRSL